MSTALHCTAIYCLVYQCVKCITLSKVIAECVLVLVLLVHCVCNVCWQCAWNFWNVFLRLQLIPFFPAAWSRSADSAMLNFSRDFKFHCVWIIAVIFLWTVIDIHSLFVSSLKYVISRRHCACYFFSLISVCANMANWCTFRTGAHKVLLVEINVCHSYSYMYY